MEMQMLFPQNLFDGWLRYADESLASVFRDRFPHSLCCSLPDPMVLAFQVACQEPHLGLWPIQAEKGTLTARKRSSQEATYGRARDHMVIHDIAFV